MHLICSNGTNRGKQSFGNNYLCHPNALFVKSIQFNNMSFETILKSIQDRAATNGPLGAKLKFNFGNDQLIHLDGIGAENIVSTEDKEADCTVTVSLADLEGVMSGSINPMMAFMTGKIKVKGDMGVVMKLQGLLK